MSEALRYPKHVFWSDEDEGFIAIAPDLPGSSAFGYTESEALTELDQAIAAWIEAARAAGNAVPAPSPPASPSLPSGKVLVRMPKGLHQRAAWSAEREDVSLNQFIVACVAEAVGERSRVVEPARQIHSGWTVGWLCDRHHTLLTTYHTFETHTPPTLGDFHSVEVTSAQLKQNSIWKIVEKKPVRSMPEVNQIFFQHKEIAELLLKKEGIHEGKWMLSVNLGFGVGNFGPTPDQAMPGAVVTVLAIGIIRAAQDTPDAIQVDASIVNPSPPRSRKKS